MKNPHNAGIRELPIYLPLNYEIEIRAPSTKETRHQRQYKQFMCLCIVLACIVLVLGIPQTRVLHDLVVDGVNATKDQQSASSGAWDLDWDDTYDSPSSSPDVTVEDGGKGEGKEKEEMFTDDDDIPIDVSLSRDDRDFDMNP